MMHQRRILSELAKQIQEFIESDDVQRNVAKAKKYAKETVDEAKKELSGALDTGSAKAKKTAKTVKKKVGTKAKKAAKKGKATVKKTTKKAKKAAKTAGRRMKTSVRKVS